MPKILFKVNRNVTFGDRQYKPGEEITDLDVDSWEISGPQIERALTIAMSKDQIEPHTEVSPVVPVAPAKAEPVVQSAPAPLPNPETSG